MSVIGFHEDAIARDCDAAVGTAADRHCARARPFVTPDLPAASGIEREARIAAGHVHHSADNDRGDLQLAHVRNREHPCHCKTRDIALVDLREAGVAVPAGITVIARPVCLGRHLAKATAGAAQQVHALVIGPQLYVVKTFAEHLSFEGLAFGGLKLQLPTGNGTGCSATLHRTQELQQAGHFRTRNAAWRHASRRQAVANQTRQLPVLIRRQTQRDCRAYVAAVAIGAVASGATGLESLASGIDLLDDLCGDSQNYREEKRQHGSQILPNFLTDSLKERSFSINGIMRCTVSPSSCAD